VQAGVTLSDLDGALARAGRYYPPTPTFMGAFVGGTIATNAAGAATFRHGTTRDWVTAIRVVLASGEIVDVTRGGAKAATRVPVPTYRLPRVPKCSAGYFAAPDMDLIDLFIGSEGTLGIVTEATLRVLPARPAICLVFLTLTDRAAAVGLVDRLRREAAHSRVSAIEHIDRQFGVTIAEAAHIALLITFELADVRDPIDHVNAVLESAGVTTDVDIAIPGDRARAAQLFAAREAVPAAVNARVGRVKQAIDPRISKTAADMIVPFDRLAGLMARYDDEFRRRGLDAAVWGHISDGNLHPN